MAMRGFLFLVLVLNGLSTIGQGLANYNIVLVEDDINGLPGLQSFAVGEYEGEWVFLGGRTEGLHRRQPWASFQEVGSNKTAYVVNPESGSVWSASLASLPAPLFEQLQSSNTLFHQLDTTLYILGGYGFSASTGDHITYPNLTEVSVPALIQAIKVGEVTDAAFRQLTDERMRVTGGYLGYLDGRFYIIGGQNFEGRYNPMGPTHGPGFIQEYTNEIRSFTVTESSGTLAIADYTFIRDTANLHRRDLNVVPQIFPNGQPGFTAFSGVFQYSQDIPWLNSVDIIPGSYSVNNDFSQFLNQYHTAHIAMHDVETNSMHTVFFGGISRYTLDSGGNLVDDPDVPFVKTISLVTRDASGKMTEVQIGEMPALLGSSAEFLVHPDAPLKMPEVIDLASVSSDSLLIGYIAGGIESSLPNIFWINDGTQSVASSRLFKVYLVEGEVTSTNSVGVNPEGYFDVAVFPNPVQGDVKIEFSVRRMESIHVVIIDNKGTVVRDVKHTTMGPGRYQFEANCQGLPSGIYHVRISGGNMTATKRFAIQ